MVYIYQGLLGNQSAENVVRLLAHALKALRDDEADAIYFSGLDVGSTLCVGAAGTGGLLMRDGFPRISAHWILELPSEPDQFYARLSAKVRGKRKQEANRIFRTFGGNVRVRCFVHPHELDEMARDIESVAKLTYHRGMGVGFNLDVETIERLKIEACSQRLRAYVLYLADKPSAFFVGTVYKRTMYLHYTGYDPSQARYSSGAYLLLKIVESLCGSPVERMDFGFGHAWYKEMFCTRSWNESSFYVFAPTIKGRCLNLIRTPPLLAANIAKRIVALFHLAERIKRSWRNALRRRPQPESSAAESSSADRSFTRTA